jgi:hypothetical protein
MTTFYDGIFLVFAVGLIFCAGLMTFTSIGFIVDQIISSNNCSMGFWPCCGIGMFYLLISALALIMFCLSLGPLVGLPLYYLSLHIHQKCEEMMSIIVYYVSLSLIILIIAIFEQLLLGVVGINIIGLDPSKCHLGSFESLTTMNCFIGGMTISLITFGCNLVIGLLLLIVGWLKFGVNLWPIVGSWIN